MYNQRYSKKLKETQSKLLQYLEKEYDVEENYDNLIKFLETQKIITNRHEFKSILYLLTKISENHHRIQNFIIKIEKILHFLKNNITKTFSNNEIFEIFQKNKLILLFFIQEQIFVIDKVIYKQMIRNDKTRHFFRPELEKFRNDSENKKTNEDENLNEFKNKRQIGENDNLICKLIRDDLIEEFIIFVKKNDYPINSDIEPSDFETNPLLIRKTPTLIEYAAFFGSVQIVKFLYKNGAKLEPSLWIYAVHGNCEELIHLLGENNILPNDTTYEEVLKESIKCHHVDMMNYILNNFLEEINFNQNILSYCFHYYNFSYLPPNVPGDFIFHCACKYDHFLIVEQFLKTKSFDINKTSILILLNST